jgi:beta-mannosidase
LPGNLEEYITFSQIAQAEGLKFGIEHFRRRKPHCSGTLVWQLDDCWPVLSWSVLDYYGFGKASYYYLRRVYAPVLASFKAGPRDELELWVTNDTLAAVRDIALLRLATFAGELVWEGSQEVHVPAGASVPVWHSAPGELAGSPDRYLSVRSSNGEFASNRHFFAPIKDLQRQAAAPDMSGESVSANELHVRLRAPSNAYVYFAHVASPSESTHFSDNYFDLEPGESRDLILTDRSRELARDSLSVGSG